MGPIPDLGNLTKLTWLALDNNDLTGSLPVSLTKLGKLTYLSLGTNALTGTIPGELGDLATLKELDLQENNLNIRICIQIVGGG